MAEVRVCPECGAELPANAPEGLCPRCLLKAGRDDLGAAFAIQIRCPHCRNPIEVVHDAPLANITCPSCDSRFSLLGDQTVTYQPDESRTIGHFELLESIGTGGFGTVFKARDTELDRTVAVKIPRSGQLSPIEAELFLREARAAAQLKHPNIVAVHEVGREGDTIYIVSDFVEGITLADWLTAQHATKRTP